MNNKLQSGNLKYKASHLSETVKKIIFLWQSGYLFFHIYFSFIYFSFLFMYLCIYLYIE